MNVKKLIDDAVTTLDIGEKIDISDLEARDANSIRVRLSRELKEMKGINQTLASTFWVTKKTQEDSHLFTVTLGRGTAHKVTITKNDGSVIPYEEGISMKILSNADKKVERIKTLKEQDRLNLVVTDPSTFEKSERRIQDED